MTDISTTASSQLANSSTMIMPVVLNRHSKTIDTGRDGHTLSCGPRGDVRHPEVETLRLTFINCPKDSSTGLLSSGTWNDCCFFICTIRWRPLL
jgi:hypothetical protein